MNHYSVLQVSSLASYDEIKAAYHKAARKFHPDKQPNLLKQKLLSCEHQELLVTTTGAGEVPTNAHDKNKKCFDIDNTPIQDHTNYFLRIQNAWECLRNSDLRKIYDQELLIKSNRSNYFLQRMNAIILYPSDCSEEEYGGTDEVILSYECRCGQKIITSELDMITDDDDDDDNRPIASTENHNIGDGIMFKCHGCSLTYVLILDDH